MEKEELKELSDREFVKRFVPFGALKKKAGFFHKDIKATDYKTITDRVLIYFGKTKREFVLSQPAVCLHIHPGVVTGRMPSHIDKDGKLNQNGFKLTLY